MQRMETGFLVHLFLGVLRGIFFGSLSNAAVYLAHKNMFLWANATNLKLNFLKQCSQFCLHSKTGEYAFIYIVKPSH